LPQERTATRRVCLAQDRERERERERAIYIYIERERERNREREKYRGGGALSCPVVASIAMEASKMSRVTT
jgi:hypothetical protein